MTAIFETTDPDLVSDILREQYTEMTMQIRDGKPLLRIAQTQLGRARLDRTTFGMSLEGNVEPLTTVNLVRVRSGTAKFTMRDTDTTYGPADICNPVPPWATFALALQQFDCDALMLDPALLDQAAGVEPDMGTPVQLLSDRPHTPLLGAHLWRLSDALGAQVRSEPEAWTAPLVADSAARLLAAATLTAFPHNALLEPTSEDRHDAHPANLRRAIAFIESRPDHPIGVIDIARAAYVTPRAIQLAFRRHLDTTPMTYLRRVRLARAHADLQAADPANTTVAAIATRWGFASPGRFAAHYHRAYGRTPVATLHDSHTS